MRRRDFIKAVAGSSVAWPLAARAQQPDRMRFIGALSGIADEPILQARYAAFLQELKQLGWTGGRNIRIEYRYGGGDLENTRRQAVELVALAPDVILATGGPATERLLQATRTGADRVCNRPRSSRLRLGCSPVASRWQCHRLCAV